MELGYLFSDIDAQSVGLWRDGFVAYMAVINKGREDDLDNVSEFSCFLEDDSSEYDTEEYTSSEEYDSEEESSSGEGKEESRRNSSRGSHRMSSRGSSRLSSRESHRMSSRGSRRTSSRESTSRESVRQLKAAKEEEEDQGDVFKFRGKMARIIRQERSMRHPVIWNDDETNFWLSLVDMGYFKDNFKERKNASLTPEVMLSIRDKKQLEQVFTLDNPERRMQQFFFHINRICKFFCPEGRELALDNREEIQAKYDSYVLTTDSAKVIQREFRAWYHAFNEKRYKKRRAREIVPATTSSEIFFHINTLIEIHLSAYFEKANAVCVLNAGRGDLFLAVFMYVNRIHPNVKKMYAVEGDEESAIVTRARVRDVEEDIFQELFESALDDITMTIEREQYARVFPFELDEIEFAPFPPNAPPSIYILDFSQIPFKEREQALCRLLKDVVTIGSRGDNETIRLPTLVIFAPVFMQLDDESIRMFTIQTKIRTTVPPSYKPCVLHVITPNAHHSN
uniref:Uncharacterized protein n=1 Tax=Mucochytrium quahogii TaxID=96639 RepID=A0A7S2W2I1_9STRA|mmetsp:Transcript_7807/g.14428  ORF Transcript_7807/g.14428 Transcript_7807/m.14428 type:complete len:509 (+) Transcript_7807:115-1641(+)